MSPPPPLPSKFTEHCPDCGQLRSKRAEKCPHCGVKIARTGGCAWLVAIFFGIGFTGLIVSTFQSEMFKAKNPELAAKLEQQRAIESAERDVADKLFRQAEGYIERHLKAPATAKFTSRLTDRHTGIRKNPSGTWTAFGQVDSQNSFGAILRNPWRVVLKPADGGHEIVFAGLGSQLLVGTRDDDE